MSDAKAPPERPVWFDAATHSIGTGGIFETATGTLLDDDGEPLSLAVRMQRRDAEAAAAAAAAEAEAADKPARPGRRDTTSILAGQIAGTPGDAGAKAEKE